MSEVQTAEQIEAEARAEQEAARAASLARKNIGGRPPKIRPEPALEAMTDEEAPEKTNLQRQALNQEAAEARRLERLKAARKPEMLHAEPMVMCRITKKGDGKISTGNHVTGLGDTTYERGEIVPMPISTARHYEDGPGYVEIVDDED